MHFRHHPHGPLKFISRQDKMKTPSRPYRPLRGNVGDHRTVVGEGIGSRPANARGKMGAEHDVIDPHP